MANQSGKFLAGVLVGTAIGAVTGILLAPRSGRETRKLLRQSAQSLPHLADDLSTSVDRHAHHLSVAAQQRWQSTLERLQVAIAAGVAASQESQQTSRESEPAPSTPPWS